MDSPRTSFKDIINDQYDRKNQIDYKEFYNQDPREIREAAIDHGPDPVWTMEQLGPQGGLFVPSSGRGTSLTRRPDETFYGSNHFIVRSNRAIIDHTSNKNSSRIKSISMPIRKQHPPKHSVDIGNMVSMLNHQNLNVRFNISKGFD